MTILSYIDFEDLGIDTRKVGHCAWRSIGTESEKKNTIWVSEGKANTVTDKKRS